MSTPQHPINSGFTADSTIGEVLEGVDLTGKLAIVTGGCSGIGTAVTRGLSDAGATAVVPARHPDQARKVIGGVAGVEIAELDLADLGSVERFAGDFLASDRGVDMLINNAAVMANELTRVGPDGWESQFAIDHLGHRPYHPGLRDLHGERRPRPDHVRLPRRTRQQRRALTPATRSDRGRKGHHGPFGIKILNSSPERSRGEFGQGLMAPGVCSRPLVMASKTGKPACANRQISRRVAFLGKRC
jgi:hypothetical protein